MKFDFITLLVILLLIFIGICSLWTSFNIITWLFFGFNFNWTPLIILAIIIIIIILFYFIIAFLYNKYQK